MNLCAGCGHHQDLHDPLDGCTLSTCTCEGFEEAER